MGFLASPSIFDDLDIYLAIVLLICAHYSDKLGIRSVFIYAGLVLLLIGYSINISDASDGVKYFGTFLLVTGSYASAPGMVAWYVPVSLFELQPPNVQTF